MLSNDGRGIHPTKPDTGPLYEIHDHQICNLLKYGKLKKVQNILGEGDQIKYGLFPLFVTFFYMHASLSEAV